MLSRRTFVSLAAATPACRGAGPRVFYVYLILFGSGFAGLGR